MPGSSATPPPAALPGLQVRAWAIFDGSGTVLKSSGATFQLQSTGYYSATFLPAMPDANIAVDIKPFNGSSTPAVAYNVNATTTSVTWYTGNASGAGVTMRHYVAIYG